MAKLDIHADELDYGLPDGR